MIYASHNLRTDLQEWKSRLYKATFSQFGTQLKFFFNNLTANKQLYGLINECVMKYPYTDEELDTYYDTRKGVFENEMQLAAHFYQFARYLAKESPAYNFHNFHLFGGTNFTDKKESVIETIVVPIINYLHDKLDKSSSTIFLLEKYKKRTEWFTKKKLIAKYNEAQKNYEQVLEDDLRLFLFDQGIDYPFSTPKSASGRADIVGEIDTEDPLIAEIKIVDKSRGYGKNRIIEGFAQIKRYANDYHKDFGYLIIYNFDKEDIHFKFENAKTFPPMLTTGNKSFFFVVVNMHEGESASKAGKASAVEVTEQDLINN